MVVEVVDLKKMMMKKKVGVVVVLWRKEMKVVVLMVLKVGGDGDGRRWGDLSPEIAGGGGGRLGAWASASLGGEKGRRKK